jgi:23S rRNA pseudouridine1911/1915/1917 synthase
MTTGEQPHVEHRVRSYEAGWAVETVLARSLLLPERVVKRLARQRAIRVNRRTASLATLLEAGDLLTVRFDGGERSGIEPAEIPLDILHEDGDLLVVNKPPYLLVHPARADQRHTLVNGIAHHYRKAGVDARVHPVHRLDQNTSGLVLVAKSPQAHQMLDEQLKKRELTREYLAFAWGRISEESGTVDAPIGRHPTQPVLRAVHDEGEPAVTRFAVLERFPAATMLRLALETGRTHQIRVHLAHLGHPLVGDRQYGRRGLKLIRRQALHAFRLSFRHPRTDLPFSLEAPLPDELVTLRETLRTTPPAAEEA